MKNQNISIIKEEKNDCENIIINKDSINFDINSFLNEYRERVNDKEKENKDYIIREKEKDNNDNSDNNSENDDNIVKNNGEINDTKIVINNIDFKAVPQIKENDNLNTLDRDLFNFDRLSDYILKNDFDNKINFSSIPNGIEEEKEEFLKKKRNSENYEEIYDENEKIDIKEINSIIIPKNIKEKFLINVTYLNKNDNYTYTRDFESDSKMIPQNYLLKYYEYILFEKCDEQKICKKLK